MEIFDPYVREELLARLERDPSSLSLYKAPARGSCVTIVAVVAAFACGFAIGAWWFT